MSLPTESRPVILITGVSPGPSIGQSSALAFLSSGYRVFGTCRVGQLDLAKKLIHAGVEVVELELGDGGSLVKVARTVEERTGGRLDVLVNNAASLDRSPLLTFPYESMSTNLMANVAGPMRLTQLLAPMLIKTSSTPGRGRGVIVNVSTAGAGIPVPLLGFQLATKAANQTLYEVLRYEMEPFNVGVYSAKLGYIKTATLNGEQNPIDSSSPNHHLYASDLPQMLTKAQKITQDGLDGGTDVDECGRWMVELCQRQVGGGPVWYGQKAWIVRYIYYWLPQWLLDRAITRAGLIQSVKQVVRRTENVTEKRLKGE